MHIWFSFLNIPSHLRENPLKSWPIYRKLNRNKIYSLLGFIDKVQLLFVLDSGMWFWILGRMWFWILESVSDTGTCFWILGRVFGWEVFWNLGSVLSLWATVEIALHSKNFGAEDGFQQEISDCGFCGNVSDWRCFKPIEWVYHLLNIFVYLKRIIFFTCISGNWRETVIIFL